MGCRRRQQRSDPRGRPLDVRSAIDSRLRIVSPGYFATMGIPIVKGRALTNEDRRGGLKVMVISGTLAAAAFPGRIRLASGSRAAKQRRTEDGPTLRYVVGVARDVRSRGLGEAPLPEFYLPMWQVPTEAWAWIQRGVYLVARTRSTRRRSPIRCERSSPSRARRSSLQREDDGGGCGCR